MQLALPFAGPTPLAILDARLRRISAPPAFFFPDPVTQLVLAILGSKTRDAVSMTAFEALRRAFPDWADLCDVAPDILRPILRDVTFADMKAVQLPAALRAIRARRGRIDLDFLEPWPIEPARAWLMSLPGAGPKVSAAVLNFSRLKKRALVVDTHYLRVTRRLGLLRPEIADDRAYRALERLLPDAWSAERIGEHHWLVKTHGQRFCHAAAPFCARCPLGDLCAAGTTRTHRPDKKTGAPLVERHAGRR